jgi:hypothetical protein
MRGTGLTVWPCIIVTSVTQPVEELAAAHRARCRGEAISNALVAYRSAGYEDEVHWPQATLELVDKPKKGRMLKIQAVSLAVSMIPSRSPTFGGMASTGSIRGRQPTQRRPGNV